MEPSHLTDQPPRRSFLRWAVHGLGALFAVLLGVPAAAYIIDPRNRPKVDLGFRAVDGVRFNDLEPGKPVQGVIRNVRTDAWTLHPNDVVGRVWIIKDAAGKLEAFTTVCPHLGCSINLTPPSGFSCPCHGAKFDIAGKAIHAAGEQNPAPRDMDALECRQKAGEPDVIEVKYVNYKQGVPGQEPVT